jgi:hypothetical protein
MSSHYINGYGSSLVVKLNSYQILKEPHKIGLINFTAINNIPRKNNTFRLLWYTYPPNKTTNSTDSETEQLEAKVKKLEYKTNKLPYSKNEDPEINCAKIDIIEITEGMYELDELIEEIKKNKRVQEAEVQFNILKNQRKIKINPKYAFLDFNVENLMNKILGYTKRALSPNTFTISDYYVDIFSINSIKIKINVINCNYENGNFYDNYIYQFPLNTPIGEKIVEKPATPIYLPLNTDVIRELYIDIVDQDDKPVDFGNVIMQFHIKMDYNKFISET